MVWRKIFRRTVSILFIVSIMSFAAITRAEIYTGEGSYVMSEGENLGVTKERAKADAMRNASEQACVYVKNYSRMKNFKLEEDVIETMTATILKLIGSPNFFPLETVDNLEGVLINVVVKVEIDDSDITRWLNKSEQEKSTLVSQMEALRKANEEQAKQIAELKRQLANNPQDKEEITKKFADEDKIFLSNKKVDEGWKLCGKGDCNGAIKVFDEAIELNPKNHLAHYGRGTAYSYLNQYDRAIQDFNKAIQLNPNYSNAYYNRGESYRRLKQKERAIQDFNKAIQLNPNDEAAYNNRGLAYDDLGRYEQAIQDYTKAIELNPNDYVPYNNRGVAYMDGLKQYKLAIQDFNKAIQLNPNDSVPYNNRGVAYGNLGQYERAISDYNKAIQLNPNDDMAYTNRGSAYYSLKKYQQALKDFDKALEINPNDTRARNNRDACLKALGK